MDLPGLTGKWLELLQEAVPGLARVAVLWDPTTGPHQANALRTAAGRLGWTSTWWRCTSRSAMARSSRRPWRRGQGRSSSSRRPFVGLPRYAQQIAGFTVQHQLPAISLFKAFAEAGGLMAYGPNLVQFFGRVAVYVDKISGAPAGAVGRRPTKCDLVLDLKTAQALGITFPRRSSCWRMR